jgi:hypothetical protein
MMIRYQVAEEGVAAVVAAIEAAFAAVAAQQPHGVRYIYGRRAGSSEFVAVLELDEGIDNPLFGIAEARALQSTISRWVVGDAPTPQALDVIGSYGSAR